MLPGWHLVIGASFANPNACLCCPAADCSATQEFDAASGTCSCRQGWAGPGTCSACQTGAACDALFATSGATCSNEVAFQQGMPFKAYTCDLAVRAWYMYACGPAWLLAMLFRGGCGFSATAAQVLVPASPH